jgi:hypothetical protein
LQIVSGVEKCLFIWQLSFFWFCLFFFLEFRQSSSGDFVLMYRNGFDGVYGPLGTFLSELFPTNIRYSGTSLAFNMAGIIRAFCAYDCDLAGDSL